MLPAHFLPGLGAGEGGKGSSPLGFFVNVVVEGLLSLPPPNHGYSDGDDEAHDFLTRRN